MSTSREFASSNIDNNNQQNEQKYEQYEQEQVQPVQLPKIQPSPNHTPTPTVDSMQYNYSNNNNQFVEQEQEQEQQQPQQPQQPKKVYNTVTSKAKIIYKYKYNGKGFDVLKRNNNKPIYTSTNLFCRRTFGSDKDDAGKQKLIRFLVKRGGFKKNCIEKIIIRDDGFNPRYGLITIKDSIKNINLCMKKINNYNGRNSKIEGNIIEISIKKTYREWRAEKNKLFIKNFDIISKNCHYEMTKIFLKFGELEEDIFINKDKFGNPFCFVTYKDINDSISCWRNQNIDYYANKPIYFGGHKLEIQYAKDIIMTNNNNNNGRNGRNKNKNKNKRSKKFYNTRK